MNQRDLFIKRSRVKNLIEMSNRNRNVLKWSPTETDAHIQMKLEICKSLKRQGKEFYTEAKLTGGKGRADIINADDGIIIEVTDSESDASILAKKQKYPLPMIVVTAKQEFKEELIL